MILFGVFWLGAVVTGLSWVVIHSNTPSHSAAAPAQQPAESKIVIASGRPLLIMFAHPKCPCTRASIGELNQLMSDCQGKLEAQVWFIKPAGTPVDWTNTDLWSSATKIPGVSVHCDGGEVEARRFKVETSGETLLYDRDGHLLFQGGITSSRGHFGDSAGLLALESLVKGKSLNVTNTPVYGCSLFDDECKQGQVATISQNK